MDIKQLKAEVEKYLAAMQHDERFFSFVALEPLFPSTSNMLCVIKVKADWIDNGSMKQAIDYMVDKLFEVLDVSVRMFIHRIDIIKNMTKST